MGKIGKWLLIFGIIALVSAIAFGCTVAAFGVANANYGINIFGIDLGGINMGNTGILFRDGQTNISYDFEKDKAYNGELDGTGLSDILLELASCRATVNCAETNKITLTYTTSGTPVEFVAECSDGVLRIKEKPATIFSFGSFKSSELSLTVPKTLYNAISVELASGKINATDIASDSFKAEVASGSLELGIYSEKIDINLASGKIDMTNCTDNTSDRVKVNVASGSVNMNGFKANNTEVEAASGHVTLNGISGAVKGELASGKLVLTYAEWNNDLSVELMSGSVDVTLPTGSGANVELKRLSGSMSVDLDGQSERLTKNTSMTIGGSNVHNVKAETASGSVSIHN